MNLFLVKMEKMEKVLDKNDELVIPEDVLNLFALMDFAGDGKIKYDEFMKATMHYRRLGMLFTIDFLPAHRKALLQKMKPWKKYVHKFTYLPNFYLISCFYIMITYFYYYDDVS